MALLLTEQALIPEILTRQMVKARMQEAFPGLTVQETSYVGGCMLEVFMWRFRLTVSLTEQVLSVTQDTKGEARIAFDDGSDFLRHATVKTEEELKAELTWVTEHIYGIIGALEAAFQSKPEPPMRSILDDLEAPG